MVMPNKTANTITVRATAPVMDVYRAADPRQRQAARRSRARRRDPRSQPQPPEAYGINLSAYALNLFFSPELAPPKRPPGIASTVAAALQPEYDLAGRQHGGLLSRRADRGGQLPRERLSTPRRWQAAAARRRRAEADAEPRRRDPGHLDGVRRGGGRRVRDHSAVVLQLPDDRRQPRDHAAGHLRGEILLELVGRKQLARRERRRRRSVGAVVQSRKVSTRLRLREGEANLLAGLVRTNSSNAAGFPGLMRLPGIRQLFSQQRGQRAGHRHRDADHAAHRPQPRGIPRTSDRSTSARRRTSGSPTPRPPIGGGEAPPQAPLPGHSLPTVPPVRRHRRIPSAGDIAGSDYLDHGRQCRLARPAGLHRPAAHRRPAFHGQPHADLRLGQAGGWTASSR